VTFITANSLFISIVYLYFTISLYLIIIKTLSTFDCLGCYLTSFLDLANSGTLAQEETFPVRCWFFQGQVVLLTLRDSVTTLNCALDNSYTYV